MKCKTERVKQFAVYYIIRHSNDSYSFNLIEMAKFTASIHMFCHLFVIAHYENFNFNEIRNN